MYDTLPRKYADAPSMTPILPPYLLFEPPATQLCIRLPVVDNYCIRFDLIRFGPRPSAFDFRQRHPRSYSATIT